MTYSFLKVLIFQKEVLRQNTKALWLWYTCGIRFQNVYVYVFPDEKAGLRRTLFSTNIFSNFFFDRRYEGILEFDIFGRLISVKQILSEWQVDDFVLGTNSMLCFSLCTKWLADVNVLMKL